MIRLAIAITVLTVALVATLPSIHAWERQNDFPFGLLCEAYGTCGK